MTDIPIVSAIGGAVCAGFLSAMTPGHDLSVVVLLAGIGASAMWFRPDNLTQ